MKYGVEKNETGKTYGKGRGGKGVEKTVVSKSESDGGGEPETVAAASSIYQAAVRNSGGNKSASLDALRDR